MKKILQSFIEYFSFFKSSTEEAPQEWIDSIKDFYKIINYEFQNENLIRASLTHNSYLRKSDTGNFKVSPFERMEFLGDSILGLIVAEELFMLYPNKKEGFLSKLKAQVVCERFLAKKASDISLGEFILMSEEESRSGGKNRASITSDSMESLICAIYLDSDMETTKEFIKTFILKNFETEIKKHDIINYKSRLQEYTQGKFQKTPNYKLINEVGPDHDKIFTIEVFVNNDKVGIGKGRNKKEAQQNAAKKACKTLSL